MSYILLSNVGTLLGKYKPIVGNEIKDILTIVQQPNDKVNLSFDLGVWFEWSFNYILHDKFFIDVRGLPDMPIFKSIYRAIEPEYVRAFVYCLDQNANVLDRLPQNLTARAVLSNETVIISTSAKIDL